MTIIACCCNTNLSPCCVGRNPLPDFVYLSVSIKSLTGPEAGIMDFSCMEVENQPMEQVQHALGIGLRTTFEWNSPGQLYRKFQCLQLWGPDGDFRADFPGWINLQPPRTEYPIYVPELVLQNPNLNNVRHWAPGYPVSCDPIHLSFDVQVFPPGENSLNGDFFPSCVFIPDPVPIFNLTFHVEITE